MNWLDIRSSENLGRIRESGTTQIILPNISCQITTAATAGQVCMAWFAPPALVTGHGYLICPHCHLCKLPPPSLEHSAVSPLLSLPASHAQSGVGVSDCQHLTRAQLPGKLGKQVYGALISSGRMWALVDEVGLPSTWGGGGGELQSIPRVVSVPHRDTWSKWVTWSLGLSVRLIGSGTLSKSWLLFS